MLALFHDLSNMIDNGVNLSRTISNKIKQISCERKNKNKPEESEGAEI